MYKSRFVRATTLAMLAQLVSMGVSALTVFWLASALSPVTYGRWQLYLLLGSFSGLFHLGLCDGVYLRLGGRRFDELDLPREGSIFRRMNAVLSAVATVGVVAVCLLDGVDGRGTVYILALSYMPLFNAAAYLGFVQQATDNTAVYSLSVVIERLSFGGAVAAAVVLGATDFRIYAACSIASKLAALVYLALKSKNLLTAPAAHGVGETVRKDISSGFRLMSAHLAGHLTTGAARLAVIYNYGDATFGKVSFAITLAGLFLQFISQLTMVLFPTLRRQDGAGRREAFGRLGRLARLLLPGVLLAYLPLKTVISAFLPSYAAEMEHLALLLPLCLFEGNVHLVGASYLKVSGRVGLLWGLELTAAATALALCFGAAYIGLGVAGILTAAVVASVLRSLLFDVAVGEGAWQSTAWLLLSATVFLLTASLMGDVPALLSYGVLYLGYLGVMMWRRGGLPALIK